MAEDDVYICPAGERLAYSFTTEDKGLVLPVRDRRLPALRHQAQLHDRQGAPDYPMGA